MNKINNNISFTSKIRIIHFPKFQHLNDIRYGTREFIVPCLPNKATTIPVLEKMVNKQTRTCTSINLIFRPDESADLFIKPVHLHHDTSIHKLVPFLKRMIKNTPNIQSIIMWGHKKVDGFPGEKVFDKAFEILSKEKEVTYFKGHSLLLDAETNALYTNQSDTMYLAPKGWVGIAITPTNETDLKKVYDDFHIAAQDELSFDCK